MKRSSLFSEDWCNIIFENRNKAYGAYRIRKNAGRRYAFALLVLVGSMVGLTLIYFGWQWAKVELMEASVDVELLSELEKPEAREGHELKSVAGGRKRTPMPPQPKQASTTPEVSETEKLSELILGTPSIVNIIKDGTNFVPIIKDTSPEEDLDQDLVQPTYTVTEKVEPLPQFPGGLAAMMKWLDANIIYPPECQRRKITGTVEVTFVVDEKGQVKDPKITQSVHAQLDVAALHAIRKMPRWKPGMIKGKAVPVGITIPVQFSLQ